VAVKLLAAVGTLLLGAVVGLSSAALHQHWWGFALAVAATGTTAYALPPGWWARIPFAVGWAAMVGYLAMPRDEGDYVVAGDVPGYLLLGCAVVLAVGAMVTIQPLRRTHAAEESPPS